MVDSQDPYPQPELSNQQLRMLLEGLEDHAIFFMSPEGTILTWNRGARRVTGYEAAEVVGRPHSLLFSPEDVEKRVPAEFLRAAQDGRVTVEGWRIRKDGARFWAYTEISCVRDPGGVPLGYVEITCDVTEQKTAQENLARTEEVFRLLVQSVQDYAIYMLDRRGNVVSWNPGAERIKGYKAEEIIGQHYSRFYTPEDIEAKRPQENLRVAADEGHYRGEGWRRRKDGSRFWASVVLTALRDDRGRLRGFAKVTRDVSARKRSDEMLRLSEERYRQLVDGIKDLAVYMLSPEGLITSWNLGAARVNGYHADEVIGKHFSMFYTEQDIASKRPEHDLRVAGEQGQYSGEGWRLRRDGTLFWADVTTSAIRDEAGTLRGYSTVTRDVSVQRKAHEELRRSEERFRQLVEGVREYAIFMVDPDGRIASWNAGAERLKGYRSDEVLGKPISIFYTAEDRRTGKPDRLLELALSEGQTRDEGWRVRKDGTPFWAEVVITAIYDAGGLLQGFSKLTRDVSERRRKDEEIQKLNRHLQERVTDLDAFASTVAHDVRSPLRAISSYTEMALEDCSGELGEQSKEYLQRVLHSAGHLNQLIGDLLNYSRLSRAELEVEDLDLKVLVEDVLLEMAHALEESKATVDIVKPLPSVRASKVLLRQALTNLISNAIKYAKPGATPVVRIRGERRGQAVRLWVEDEGIGIAPEDVKHLFQAFKRLSSGKSQPGTGLGLAIVRRAIERMGGRVGMEPGVPTGSRFWMELGSIDPS